MAEWTDVTPKTRLASTGRGKVAQKWSLLMLASSLAWSAYPVSVWAQAPEEGANVTPVFDLAPIVVEGEASVVTEGTESYTTDRATVGSKQPIEIREVPQSITVITRERLEDANANSIEEAANLIPNLSTATGDGFSGSLYSRGTEVFTYNVDGAPRPFLSIYGTAPDLIFFDRVEALSGPSGVFQGSGEPVGTLNFVRRRADFIPGAGGGFSLGSFNAKRIEADITGPLNGDGSLRGRVIGYSLAEDSFVDITGQDRGGIYGTLEWDLTDDTTLSIGGIEEEQEVIRWSGLPTFTDGTLIGFDRSTFIGAPWGHADIDTLEGFVELEHRFTDSSVLKLAAREYDRYADIKSPLATTGVDPATGEFSLITFARDYEEVSQYLDLNYTSRFTFLGNATSEFTLGTDYRRTNQLTLQRFDTSLGTQTISTFDPFSLVEPTIDFNSPGPGRLNTDVEADEVGVYGYGRLDFTDRIRLTLGGRFTTYTSDTLNNLEGVTTTINEDRFVPFVGLSYDFTEQTTGYVSYSEIFQPQSQQRADGAQLEPVLGQQVEAGVKAEMGGINAQAAVYWIQEENRAEEVPGVPGAFVAGGVDDTQGFEVLFSGSPTPGLELTAGYALVDTERETDPTPEQNLTAFAKYTFSEGGLRNWYIGAGLRAASEFDALSGDVLIEAPGYIVFDTLVGYQVSDEVDLQLFVKNVFDRTYVERINQVSRGTFYGEPLSATLKLSTRF